MSFNSSRQSSILAFPNGIKLILLTGVIGTVLLLVNQLTLNSSAVESNEPDEYISKYSCNTPKCKRLSSYCAQHSVKGKEGTGNIDKNRYELHSLLIAHRHGDRSPIHTIPGDIQIYNKSIDSSIFFYNNHALSHANQDLRHFMIIPLNTQGESMTFETTDSTHEIPSFMHALDTNGPYSIFHTSDKHLPQGQLTSTGFMQLLQLGDHLHTSYKEFIKTIDSSSQVYIRSTNYHRTIQVG